MAAKSGDLADETSGANLQIEGHADALAQSGKDLQELEVSDSPPSHLPIFGLLPGGHHPVTLIQNIVWTYW